jgi:peptidoglycan L-alanyl-D-glutamate endopeptidase CwlK
MSFKFGAKSLKLLNNAKLHPKLRHLMNEAIKTSPIDFTIIETVRTIEQQKINVAKGVSKTIKSRHIPSTNKSGLCEAIDIAPYPINWKDINRFIKLSQHIKLIAKQLKIPITWGGDFKGFFDAPHYELKK